MIIDRGWRPMGTFLPDDEEILFIAKDGQCSERIGIAVPDQHIVLLSHTDIAYRDILYWIPIPKDPRRING